MEADFSGWATKAGLKCTDGRTIMPNAFQHQDKITVPLVWQHKHADPTNVLGHAVLENRPEGVYCHAYFNSTEKAAHAKELVQHKDITMMSIWANELIERSKKVLHGAIREVSLVLSGANPGALIENIAIRHSDGDEEFLEEVVDEAIIYTGLSFEHTNLGGGMGTQTEDRAKVVEFLESLNENQQEFMHTLLGVSEEDVKHAGADATIADVVNSMTPDQRDVLNFLVGEALTSKGDMKQDALDEEDEEETDDDKKGDKEMQHNVFESDADKGGDKHVISHADFEGIIAEAKRGGSLKAAVEEYGIQHGIDDIDVLFPDAVATDGTPQFIQRRVEWVSSFLAGTTKSPFSRIKTLSADLTLDEARAKGYVKGELKKEEFFGVTHRSTTPQTVYKKQKLDRDDVVDITDFDVVAWLKAEMRVMLDEELARAALMGDGRDISHEDKIQESHIRPIATDHQLFQTTLTVDMVDASSSVQEIIDAVILNRRYYKGTGVPNFYTSETVVASFLLLKDTLGRSLYKNLDEVASVLRVNAIIPVELIDEDESLVGIIVNPVDYTFGATRGGEVSMFEDFDIDYNQHKYLIETRCCGALTRLKSALVIRKTDSDDTPVVPEAPDFDPETGELTINDTTGVVYKRSDTDATVTNGASPYTIDSGDSITIYATASSGYYFASTANTSWTFRAD